MTAGSFAYRHYGLTVAADHELAGLEPSDRTPPDVTVTVTRRDGPYGGDPAWSPTERRGVWRHGDRLRLHMAESGEWADFVIDEDGATMAVALSPRVPDTDAVHLLAGPVFSCLLAQRGACCVHAAVVAVGGRVVALAGPSGAGKSTLALALVEDGAELIADDVAALTVADGRVTVVPGTAHVRVRRDTAEALRQPFEGLRPVGLHPDRGLPEKGLVEVSRTAAGGLALDRLVFLEPRDAAVAEPATTPLEPHDVLVRLMRERHALPLLDAAADRHHFPLLSEVARSVPGVALHRPDGLATVGAVAAAVAT